MTISKKSDLKLSTIGMEAAIFESMVHEPVDTAMELFRAQGLELVLREGRYYYETAFRPLDDTLFCVVDIETNGSKPEKHQIIEIGAVKVLNRTIVDRFETLVRCNDISTHITEITGIDAAMTQDAPNLCEALDALKLFLGESVFVAHDVKFDYSFISAMLVRCGRLPLLNRTLCTIDLAERTISSYRYGLAYLNEQLELYQDATHHRALSDAITTAKLFKRTLTCLPETIQHSEELIRFSKEAKRLKRPKFPETPDEGGEAKEGKA